MTANTLKNNLKKIKSSFRDPDSQVFTEDGRIFRLIRQGAVPDYRHLMDSGLYRVLMAKGLLVPHEDVSTTFPHVRETQDDVVITPQGVPFISYPYEWSFSALKAAALATLDIQKLCLDHGMTLQDATAFNIQFCQGRWLLIDTGSFRIQKEFHAWGAYRQFCQHFLAPLLLMAHVDARLLSLFSHYLDGIPLDLASRLLPISAKLQPGVFMHIVMHSRYTLKDFDLSAVKAQQRPISKAAAYGLIDQLRGMVAGLELVRKETVWTNYENTHTYNQQEFEDKEGFIRAALTQVSPDTVWDLGANTGHFSRLVAAQAKPGVSIVSFEYDIMTVEAGERQSRACDRNRPLHLWMDLLNPTAGRGWAGEEWHSLAGRGPADLVLALALVHHLCLSGNIKFPQLVEFLAACGRYLVVEFVPKDDPQSQRLLKSRKDIYADYTQENFERALKTRFLILQTATVSATGRVLYLIKNSSN